MKKISKILLMLSGVVLGAGLQSCISEEPFDSGRDASLTFRAEVKSDVITRAANVTNNAELREKCVVYIESSKGVIRKFIGLDNIPAAPLSLKQGHYVAEGWTGDSVSASFDKKFYRGYQGFELEAGENKEVKLTCNIANVITSVNPAVLDLNAKHVEVTFSHSRGSLAFNEENIADGKGYFMMPSTDSDLLYKVVVEKNDGSTIEREGKIEGVERAHEYVMNITADEGENTLGGGLIRITIEDIPVIEDVVEIYGRPTIMGEGFDLASQIVGDPAAAPGTSKAFTDKVVYIRAYDGISKAVLTFGQGFDSFLGTGSSSVDLINPEGITRAHLEDLGIVWDGPVMRAEESSEKTLQEMRVTFKKSFFDNLAENPEEYQLEINVLDEQKPQSKYQVMTLRIANTEDAVEVKAPVETIDAPNPETDPMGILAHTATLQGIVKDDAATDYGIRYRKLGDSEWIKIPANQTRASAGLRYSVTLTGLESGTTYEYKAYEANYDNCAVLRFTTEGEFSLPNASFEEWSTYSASTMLGTKNVALPWAEGNKDKSFWGSGNEGSATANLTLTDKSADMLHSGSYSARLESKSALGVLAAGNIFIGQYVKTDGTNGVLSVGREYNGSHPSKLKVWVNYRPGNGVTVKDSNKEFLPENFAGGSDHGQIYVALATEPIEIRTNPSNRKVFDVDDPVVLGYGEVTWTSAFGPDGGLAEVEIPITYFEQAKTKKATHLVVVVSASKYGDYFSGAAGSVMYLDDFELVYEN